jgi:hypothetical protein
MVVTRQDRLIMLLACFARAWVHYACGGNAVFWLTHARWGSNFCPRLLAQCQHCWRSATLDDACMQRTRLAALDMLLCSAGILAWGCGGCPEICGETCEDLCGYSALCCYGYRWWVAGIGACCRGALWSCERCRSKQCAVACTC